MKVPLLISRFPPMYNWRRAKGDYVVPIRSALPFCKSPRSGLYHRPRSGELHYANWHLSHVAVSFWCGSMGYVQHGRARRVVWTLCEDLPENAVLCATCEGRAIGAGQIDSRTISGRTVLFSPRV